MIKGEKNHSTYTRGQQLLALSGVILIGGLFLSVAIFSIVKTDWAEKVAKGLIGVSLVLPLLIWVNLWLFGKVFHKHTIADFDFGGVPTPHDPIMTIDNTKIEENKESGDEEN